MTARAVDNCWKMRVCATVSQTEGLPFVIGAENKKAKTLTVPTNHKTIIPQKAIMDKKMQIALAKRKLSNTYNLFFTGSDLWLLLFIVYIKRSKTRLLLDIYPFTFTIEVAQNANQSFLQCNKSNSFLQFDYRNYIVLSESQNSIVMLLIWYRYITFIHSIVPENPHFFSTGCVLFGNCRTRPFLCKNIRF